MSSCPLVMIEWVDSAQPSPSWQYLADFDDPKAIACVSVGWLIHDGDDVKALAQNMGDIGSDAMQVSGVIRIPARCIVRTVELDEPDVTVSSASSDLGPSSHPEREPTRQVA